MAVGKYRDPGLKIFGNDYPTPDGSEFGGYGLILAKTFGMRCESI